ncbi:MAG: hypothetical protein ABW123_06160 [Cystobacter sp.]
MTTEASSPSNPWEQIRFQTLDALVTQTKLAGSSLILDMFTKPEGWPVTVVIAVGKPGNEPVPMMLKAYFGAAMSRAGASEHRSDNPDVKR